jgi:hypothetical protein
MRAGSVERRGMGASISILPRSRIHILDNIIFFRPFDFISRSPLHQYRSRKAEFIRHVIQILDTYFKSTSHTSFIQDSRNTYTNAKTSHAMAHLPPPSLRAR